MIINHIKLKNFGCIKSFDKDFGKGIYIFAGDNGNGKTTVFKAVAMALFDSYDGSMTEYINWYGEDFFEVSIDFEHLGFAYNVFLSQSLKGKTAERLLTDKTNNQVYTGQEAKDFLKKIFDTELLKSAMLSVEQQLDVITVKPSERRDYLKKIYDLEFKKQQTQFQDELTALNTRTTEISTELGLLRNKKYDETELPELPLTDKEYEAVKKSHADKTERLGALKSDLENYNRKKTTIADLETHIARLNEEIPETDKQITEKKKVIEDLPAESEKRVSDTKKTIEEAEKELKALAAPDQAITDLESKIAGIEIQRIGAFDAETLAKAEKELSDANQRIQALESVCPVCGLSKPKTKETEAELAEQKAKIPAYESRVSDLKAENERISKIQKQNQENKDLRTKYEHEKTLLVERRETKKRETETKIETEASNLKRLIDSAKSALAGSEELLKAKKEAKELSEKRLAEAKADTVKNPAEELSAVQKEVAENKKVIDDYEKILTDRDFIVKQREQQEKQKKEDEDRIKVLDVELQEKSKEIAEIENSLKVLKNEFPVYVISRVVKDLEIYMNDFLKRVYGGRYAIKLEDKKNALKMVYGPKNADAGSGLSSGYEKSIFSLAWKWALSRVQKNRTLLLDEADSAASQGNSLIFYKEIGDSLKLFDQILIVSHKEQTRELLEDEYNAETLTFTDGIAA